MTGLLKVIDMLGNTIEQLQAEVERLNRLVEQMQRAQGTDDE